MYIFVRVRKSTQTILYFLSKIMPFQSIHPALSVYGQPIPRKKVAHNFPKQWAMPRKTTGNVFQNHRQSFSKRWATFREITGNVFQARRKRLYHHWK